MAVINVDDIYILDETGAQVDKVTGLFTKDEDTTSGEKAFAQLNIGASGNNDNLVENGWFTVRQKGDGPFTSGWTVDRWKVVGGSPSVTGRSGYGINITASSTFAIDEEIDVPNAAWLSKTFTLSVMIDGVVHSASGVYSPSPYIGIDLYVNNLRFMFIYSATRPSVRIYGAGTTNVNIDAIKLERGPVSTLANDVPPKINSELEDCKYYFERIKGLSGGYFPFGYGVATSATAAVILIPMHPKRNRDFDVSTGGAFQLLGNGSHTVTAITKDNQISSNGQLCVVATSSGLTVGEAVILRAASSSGAFIDVNNNL